MPFSSPAADRVESLALAALGVVSASTLVSAHSREHGLGLMPGMEMVHALINWGVAAIPLYGAWCVLVPPWSAVKRAVRRCVWHVGTGTWSKVYDPTPPGQHVVVPSPARTPFNSVRDNTCVVRTRGRVSAEMPDLGGAERRARSHRRLQDG